MESVGVAFGGTRLCGWALRICRYATESGGLDILPQKTFYVKVLSIFQ